MTWQVIAPAHRGPLRSAPMSALHPAAAPHPLTTLRRARRVSQLELSLRAGVSQRHLSCIETGRARPTRATLLALLDALDAPLAERNAALLAAGLAPQYSQHGLQDAALAPARQALDAMLQAPGAAPALVLDADWNLLMANAGVMRLLDLLELPMPEQANLLDWLLQPMGLRQRLLNEAEVCGELLHRAAREAVHAPALAERLARLREHLPAWEIAPGGNGPLLFTRLRSRVGELRLFSMFSSFGAPLDVTLASLRIEHLFPADAATAAALQS